MVEGSQLVSYHLSLMTGIIQSTSFLLIVFSVWFVYSVKSSQFVISSFAWPQNSFLFTLTCLPRSHQIGYLLFTHGFIHLPVWAYALVTSLVAFKQGNLLIGIFLLSFNFLLCFTMSVISVFQLNNPSSLYRSPLFHIQFPKKKTLTWFYLSFIMNDLKLITMVTKLFSYLAVVGFFQIPLDHYENRIPFMGFLLGLTAHAILIFEIRKWEDSYLTFTKNLPLSSIKRYLVLALVYTLLIIPEIFLMIVNKVHVVDLFAVIIFGMAYLLFIHSSLYHLNMNMDRYIQFISITFLISFTLILFTLSWFLVFIYATVSISWYKKYFYSFESLRL